VLAISAGCAIQNAPLRRTLHDQRTRTPPHRDNPYSGHKRLAGTGPSAETVELSDQLADENGFGLAQEIAAAFLFLLWRIPLFRRSSRMGPEFLGDSLRRQSNQRGSPGVRGKSDRALRRGSLGEHSGFPAGLLPSRKSRIWE
jgi:hypothetical protein